MTEGNGSKKGPQKFTLDELAVRCYRMPIPFPDEFHSVDCPACQADTYSVVAFEKAFRIVKCRRCRHVYLNPVPGDSYVMAYNDALITRVIDRQDPWREARSQATDWVARYCNRRYPNGGHVLDVGAAFGDLLSRFDANLWKRSGLDLSADVAAEANQTLGEGTVQVADAATAVLPARAYDVVSLINVIEHLPDPAIVLKNIQPALAPQGILLLRWPQLLFLNSLLSLVGREYPGIQVPNHVHDFRRTSVEALLRRCDYRVLRHYVVNNLGAMKSRGALERRIIRGIDWLTRLANSLAFGRRCMPWGSVVTVAVSSRPQGAGQGS